MPSKPRQSNSRLVGKANAAMGQPGNALYTMAVSQAPLLPSSPSRAREISSRQGHIWVDAEL